MSIISSSKKSVQILFYYEISFTTSRILNVLNNNEETLINNIEYSPRNSEFKILKQSLNSGTLEFMKINVKQIWPIHYKS
jgi:hypothetical protein